MRNERFAGLQLFHKVLTEDQVEIIATYLHQLKEHDNGTTLNHSIAVMKLSTQLGILLGIKEDEFLLLQLSALLHDIGKLGVDPTILNKPGKPDLIEWKILQTHPDVGNAIALYHNLPAPIPEVIHSHQIWHNGKKGYPDALLGNGPPSRITQIVTLSDALQVMLTSDRPYKGQTRPLTLYEAVLELRDNAGTQFDPQIVETLALNIGSLEPQLPDLLSPISFISSFSLPVSSSSVASK